MELRTKKSCMKMQPKGSTPPMMIPGIGCINREGILAAGSLVDPDPHQTERQDPDPHQFADVKPKCT